MLARLVLGLVPLLGWVLLLSALAAAQTAEISQQLLDANGDPELVANPSPDGGRGEVRWQICPPGGEPCRDGPVDRSIEPGETAPGTTFEASVTYEGRTTVDRSARWLGRVAPITPPRLEGRPRVGGRVRAVGGSWSGGWGDEYDSLQVEACRRPDGMGCEQVCEPVGRLLDDDEAAVTVPARYRGWFLRAAAARTPRDAAFAAIGVACRGGLAALTAGATESASAPTGPVTGPAVRILRRAVGRDGRLVFGVLRCSPICRVGLSVTDARGRTVRHRFRIGTIGALALTRGARLAKGPVEVRVTVNGRPVASGTSRR